MSESLHIQTGSLSIEFERQVDLLCDRFEDALKKGTIPDADEYLAQIHERAHRQLLRELTRLLREYVAESGAVVRPAEGASVPLTSGHQLKLHSAEEISQQIGERPGDTTKVFLWRSLEVLQQVDDAATEFEQALNRGELPRIEDVLESADPDARDRLRRELLRLEMEFRAKRGDTPSLQEYRARFSGDERLVKYLYFENFVPTQVGDFSIQRLVGRGGFGHVYQGWDSRLSRNVAIKLFRRDPIEQLAGGGLLSEARIAARLRHPGIVAVYAVLPDDDGDEFLALEYVDGKSLEELLRSRRMPPQEAAETLLAVVQALQHAHENGLVHRDLKPANILIDQGNRPRVTDFGLAIHLSDLRRSPDIAGTLAYMAPEQANGETHRLDARTDLWAVGVTLYRALTGWLPFSGASQQELLDAIRLADPKDVRQHVPSIPPELARIVTRCLAKRMSDRHPTASALADDLEAFLAQYSARNRLTSSPDADVSASIPVVPKGLRCFDQNDHEFFLQLVPGPRDRRGVPEAVRFWEHHLEALDANMTFPVGLLYGPSGGGKTSLVRAGILPHLENCVQIILIEATRGETELRMNSEIRRRFPELPSGITLVDTIAKLRGHSQLRTGEKLVIVVDQFEQWLHGWQPDEGSELISALRQCDGGRVQALLLVRDDFWTPATRLFKQLDVPLVDGSNAQAVDLFDRAHAKRVLTAFGVAYAKIPPLSSQQTRQQQQFLERAIEELSVDGMVVPIRLCIFSEIVKSRPWTIDTLREVGGSEGLGTAFLEDTFDRPSASPSHRLHRTAARAVLEKLLPSAGNEIRGHLVPESELLSVSGYESQSEQFSELMRSLDQELRLITPSDSAVSTSGLETSSVAPSYQLTHDFLVTAIRGWLNQTRRRTIRGRAKIRLDDYAATYAARPDSRHLPTWWDWIGFSVLTHPARWTACERSLMRAATKRYSVRAGAVAVATVLTLIAVFNWIAATRADGLIDSLATSNSRDVAATVERLRDYDYWARPQLAKRLAGQTLASDERTRLLLGALAIDEAPADELDELCDRMLDSEPSLSVAIAELMQLHGALGSVESRLRRVAGDGQQSGESRLRAFIGLAHLRSTHEGDKWQSLASDAVQLLIEDLARNPRSFDAWVEGLAPIRKSLIAPLCQLYSDPDATPQEQLLAADVLLRYAARNSKKMIELALEGTPRQFEVIAEALDPNSDVVRSAVSREIEDIVPSDASSSERDQAAHRRANALLLLSRAGTEETLLRALRHEFDPRLRAFLLRHFVFQPAPADWTDVLSREKDSGVRQAIILALGAATHARSSKPSLILQQQLLEVYRNDVDPGVHSAAEWALAQFGLTPELEQVKHALAEFGIRAGFGWYVTPSGITMIIVNPPGEVVLGSPESELGRDESSEQQRLCTIDWAFAISSTEITQAKYREIVPEYREYENDYAPHAECPVNAVSWTDAQQFCRSLSEKDGVPDSEMTIPSASDGRAVPEPDFLNRTGYRLPLDAEWEVACRAGTTTSRYFGDSDEFLPYYECCINNSGGNAWRTGSGWPNPLGFFDMLGNVSEWCQDLYSAQPTSTTRVPTSPAVLGVARLSVRGHDYGATASKIRTANRRDAASRERAYSRGFRIAQTIRPKRPND